MAVNLNDRVTSLEKVLEHYIEHSQRTLDSLSAEMKDFKDEMKDFKDEMKDFKDEMKDFKDEMKDFKDEMKDFKDEMKDFKDEMKDFKDEMTEFKDEMKDFKDEMTDFKDEMKDFKDEMREDRREMNRQWGSLANKMGTLIEDIFVPGVRPTVAKYFDTEIDFLYAKAQKKLKESGEKGEFDVIAIDEKYVFLVEVKNSPLRIDIDELIRTRVPKFRRLFPEYVDKKLIPILGSLSFPPELIPYASEAGVFLLGYREWDYLDILNFDQIELK